MQLLSIFNENYLGHWTNHNDDDLSSIKKAQPNLQKMKMESEGSSSEGGTNSRLARSMSMPQPKRMSSVNDD